MKIKWMKAGKLDARRFVPEFLTGRGAEMEKRLRSAFDGGDFSETVRAEQVKNAASWILCAVFLAASAMFAVTRLAATEDETVTRYERPGYAESATRREVYVDASYGSESVSRKVEIVVRPREIDDAEKRRRLRETAERLPRLILGENESLGAVCTDLNLIERDAANAVEITWYSDRPEVLDARGGLNPVTAEAGEYVQLKARLSAGTVSETVSVVVKLGEARTDAKGLDKGLDRMIAAAVGRLSDSGEGDAVTLPDADEYGIAYGWREAGRGFPAAELVASCVFAGALYRRRFAGIDKRIAEARKSMAADFPDFINKLLLLLNAGLVVSVAIARIADEYEAHKDAARPRRLYEELSGVMGRVRETNAPLTAELGKMAARSGAREIMRFASVVTDNVDKGSALAEKLKAEEDILRMTRRKRAEEAGRTAETKMVMPMSLILAVLIIITAAPAVLEM